MKNSPLTDDTVSLSREMSIDRFRQRIAAAERTRLNKSELADLIADFIDRLMTLKFGWFALVPGMFVDLADA
jgi:hypothetical protein